MAKANTICAELPSYTRPKKLEAIAHRRSRCHCLQDPWFLCAATLRTIALFDTERNAKLGCDTKICGCAHVLPLLTAHDHTQCTHFSNCLPNAFWYHVTQYGTTYAVLCGTLVATYPIIMSFAPLLMGNSSTLAASTIY